MRRLLIAAGLGLALSAYTPSPSSWMTCAERGDWSQLASRECTGGTEPPATHPVILF